MHKVRFFVFVFVDSYIQFTHDLLITSPALDIHVIAPMPKKLKTQRIGIHTTVLMEICYTSKTQQNHALCVWVYNVVTGGLIECQLLKLSVDTQDKM